MCTSSSRVFRAAITVMVLGVLDLTNISGARAEDADLNRVYATVKRLEERVAALEAQHRQSRQEADDEKAGLKALRQLKSKASPNRLDTASAASEAYAMVRKSAVEPIRPVPIYKAVEARRLPTWDGFNAGIAFGLGQIRTHETNNDTLSFVETDPGFLITQNNTVAGRFDGRGIGGMIVLSSPSNSLLRHRFLS